MFVSHTKTLNIHTLDIHVFLIFLQLFFNVANQTPKNMKWDKI